MGWLQKLFSHNNNRVKVTLSINADTYKEGPDLRKAQCPTCHGQLKKVPGAKTKCPHCKKLIFVRTRPSDNARVLVNEMGAKKIAEDWAIAGGYHDEYLKEQQRYKDTKAQLSKRFGKEANDADIRWSLLNQDLLNNASHDDWGLYRNTIFEMGDHLKKQGRLKLAFGSYLELCYIDLNGPNNLGGIPKELRSELTKPFDPTTGTLAPGIVYNIKQIKAKLHISDEELQKMYLFGARKHYNSLKLYPLSAEDSWPLFVSQLNENQ